MAAVQVKFAMPTWVQRIADSVCVTRPAAAAALLARPVSPTPIQIPAVSAAVTQRAAAAVKRDLNVTVTQPLLVVVSVPHLSVAVVRQALFVTRQPGSVCAIVLAAAGAQPEPRATPMPLRKPVVSACVTPPAAEIAQRERCVIQALIQTPVDYAL